MFFSNKILPNFWFKFNHSFCFMRPFYVEVISFFSLKFMSHSLFFLAFTYTHTHKLSLSLSISLSLSFVSFHCMTKMTFSSGHQETQKKRRREKRKIWSKFEIQKFKPHIQVKFSQIRHYKITFQFISRL